jgi:hypothetical protein
MVGSIVEIEGKEGLFVVVKMKNYEDAGSCSYDRVYHITPYQPDLDVLEVKISEATKFELRGIKNKINIREDKQEYSAFGHSNIRGIEIIHLERVWPEIIVPSR